MNAANYRNILFDFGNVLIDIDPAKSFDELGKLIKSDTDPAILNEVIVKYETGLISTNIFINSILKYCRYSTQAREIIDAWNSMLIGIPAYRLEMLTMLRPKYNLYLISNTCEMHTEWIHKHLEKTHGVVDFEKKYFDGVYYSHLIKARKPDTAFFQFIIDDTLLTPAQTIFIDDVKAYVDAAAKIGFGTHWLQPGNDIAEYLKVEGFY